MERKWTGPIPDPQEHHAALAMPSMQRTHVYFYYEAESGKVLSRVEDHKLYSTAMSFLGYTQSFAGPDCVAKAKAHVEKAWAEKDLSDSKTAEALKAGIASIWKRELRVGGIGRDE